MDDREIARRVTEQVHAIIAIHHGDLMAAAKACFTVGEQITLMRLSAVRAQNSSRQRP